MLLSVKTTVLLLLLMESSKVLKELSLIPTGLRLTREMGGRFGKLLLPKPPGVPTNITLNKSTSILLMANCCTYLMERTKQSHFLKMLGVILVKFDAVIISSEVGYDKPDSKIFKAALDGIGVDASKAVHVEDDH